MAYRFKPSDPSPEAALRRIALEEIESGVAELDDAGMDLHDKVHQLRKRAKKLRGLIRLVRPAFPDYAAENAAIRDAARRLSGLRDYEGMVETFDKLAAATRDDGFAPIRAHLVAVRDAAAAKGHVEDDLAAFRAALLALRGRVAGWSLDRKGFKALRGGLEKTFARARHGRAAAAGTPEMAVIHDWRKRVKYHWYHTRLLRPLNDAALTKRAHQLKELSELLGDHHDLAVLDGFVAGTQGADTAPPPGDPVLWARFRAQIATRQDALATEAQTLGTRLFASPARDLGRRWSRWWKAWRA